MGCCGSASDSASGTSLPGKSCKRQMMANRSHAAENAGQGLDSPDPFSKKTLLGSVATDSPDFGTTGGKRLGGYSGHVPKENVTGADVVPTAASRRRLVADAPERRQANIPGMSLDRGFELREKRQKDELLGKLTEHYALVKVEMPMGLKAASASVEQLRTHWESVRSDADSS